MLPSTRVLSRLLSRQRGMHAKLHKTLDTIATAALPSMLQPVSQKALQMSPKDWFTQESSNLTVSLGRITHEGKTLHKSRHKTNAPSLPCHQCHSSEPIPFASLNISLAPFQDLFALSSQNFRVIIMEDPSLPILLPALLGLCWEEATNVLHAALTPCSLGSKAIKASL